MNQDKILQSLFQEVSGLAKTFLKEQGEFYPCAVILDEFEKVVPLDFYTGEEFPETQTFLLEMLEESKKNYSIYAELDMKEFRNKIPAQP